MERHLTASEARAKFLQLVDDATRGDQIIVTKHGTPAVVLIDFERLQTLRSVARLWQDPEAMAAMREASDNVAKGRVLRTKKVLTTRELIRRARRQGLLGG